MQTTNSSMVGHTARVIDSKTRGRTLADAQPASAQAALAVKLGPLARYVGYALRRAQLAVFASFTSVLSQFDLKPGQFAVLIVIDENPGLRATDVCNALGFQKTNFAPLIRTLEQRGLVRRRSSKHDRRTQTLQLTAHGQRLLTRATKIHKKHERAVAARIGSAGIERLIEQLNALAHND